MTGLLAGRRTRALFSLARLLPVALLVLLATGALGARHAWTSLPARTALLVLSTAYLLLRRRK